MTKFFKKSKNPSLGPFGPFLHEFLDKNEFPWKKGICQFLAIPVIYHHAKNQKKIMCHSRGKCWSGGWMNRQTKGLTENRNFVGPSVGQESQL